MTQENKLELTDAEISAREVAINGMIISQRNRISTGACKAVEGTITLIVLETLRKTLKEDVTVIFPNKEFGAKFTKSLAVVIGILGAPKMKVDDVTIWIWGRSRLHLVEMPYYKTNKQKFWGTFVNEIRL